MSNAEMMQKIKELKEMKELLEEAKKTVEALEEEIKVEMEKRNTEELEVGTYIVRWTKVLSNRFDSTAFKKVMPDVYKAYVKQVMSRRFTVSG
jgi:predicted phage-related endonuclease